MLKIRLTRTGKKKQPNYRIVVAEHTAPIQGKFIEILGNYNPFTKKIVLDHKKTEDWLKNGAKPSNTAAKLLQKEGLKHSSIIIKKFKAKSKKQLEEEKKLDEEKKVQEAAEKESRKVEFEQEQAEKAEEKASEEPKADNQPEEEKPKNKEVNSSKDGRTANEENPQSV
ncbi:30S ribosomal protein S16 [Candidatus Berkelbacteria bacterium RIFCSPHIGHO2_12_FULL_36_9]|uniref:Small ribosomal subunit protein bS16 n=1 Tax=Candidatus Berkelbacteria bacterium RIFCSPHIGHO2_12_FULL_36_9 TaxID=1797469 RepID=A0A1F5EKW6_9BACT|nr:MAG: 30S ribosomal protein S16 [Candidatus Berkelbacteria bacterium RIFCSPHIGHO2_12_FULL_36_9]